MRYLAFMVVMACMPMASYGSSTVTLTSSAWTQITSTSPLFAMQSLCGDIIYIKPSATQPAVNDIDGAFEVSIRQVWNQNINTTDLWWARVKSQATCRAVVEEIPNA